MVTAQSPKPGASPEEIEALAEAVHRAYLDTCARLGWPVKPSNAVPYAALSEDSKELDRASVRAVLAALTAAPPLREEAIRREERLAGMRLLLECLGFKREGRRWIHSKGLDVWDEYLSSLIAPRASAGEREGESNE